MDKKLLVTTMIAIFVSLSFSYAHAASITWTDKPTTGPASLSTAEVNQIKEVVNLKTDKTEHAKTEETWHDDTVYPIDKKVSVGLDVFTCTAPHLSVEALTKPGTGTAWTDAWTFTGKLMSQADIDSLAGKQDTLVSGTNIKTINGVSVLGAGDLTVEGGAGTDDQTATEVAFTPTATRPESNTQAAIEGLDGEINDFPFLEFDATQFIEDTTTTPGTNKVSIDPAIIGGSGSIAEITGTVHSNYPSTPGDLFWNDTGVYLRNNTEVVLVSTTTGGLPVGDYTAPTIAPAFAADGTLALYATDNEVGALTGDCTKFTADCATAGPIAFTGTGPCTASPSVYSGDTCSGADAGGTVVDAAGNPSAALSFASVDNTVNATTGGTATFTQERSPTGDGTGTWATSSGTDLFSLIDDSTDATNDGDTTYITQADVNGSQYFTFSSFSAAGTISSVTVTAYCKNNGVGTVYLEPSLKIGASGTIYNATGLNVGSSVLTYTEYSATWLTNPATGVAWTADDVNGVSVNDISGFGFNAAAVSSGEAVLCTNAWIEATYEN